MKTVCAIFLFLMLFAAQLCGQQGKHSFEIKTGDFVLDGKPFQIHSGEMHFARIPKEYWRHRLKMAKAMGLNAVATYVFWNYHEVQPGVWDFTTESRDIAQFFRIAQEEGLWVILRPGPYACAEWEFGGYPWFLQKEEGLVVRANNPAFLKHTKEYFNHLAGQVKDLQVTRGGPIIMVQIENEYGSYGSDMAYKLALKKQLEDAGFDVPFFTSDGDWVFEGGTIPGVQPTANGEDNVDTLKARVNRYNNGQGPYMVAEFYPGWLDHWAEPFEKVPKEDVANQMAKYLRGGVSFNFYMFHGGTNFAFTSGANNDRNHDIQPSITSYDYDAPLSEAGWPTAKYMMLRDTLKSLVDYEIPPVPDSLPVIRIPQIPFTKAVNLFDLQQTIRPVEADHPLTFEELNQGSGYVLYNRICREPLKGTLSVDGLRDYALVYVNHKRIAELDRYYNRYACPISIGAGDTLDILVENMGRINYGAEILHNTKGIISPVAVDGTEVRGGWKMYQMPFDRQPDLSLLQSRNGENQPMLYEGSVTLEKTGDTFLDMHDYGKGIVFVNGHNIGRFWNIGPQQSLYIPGCWLKVGSNKIIIFEMNNSFEYKWASTVPTPSLDQLNTRNVKIAASFDRIRSVCLVNLSCEDGQQGTIYYTKDGSDPSPTSLIYTGEVHVESTATISAIAYRNGFSSGKVARSSIAPSLSWGKELAVANRWSNKYPGEGEYTLVDGIRGTKDHRDGYWQGYEGSDLKAVVDLEKEMPLKKISLGCLQDIGAWIFLPDTVEVLTSLDGRVYSSAGVLTHQTVKDDKGKVLIKDFSIEKPGLKARYVKVIAKNIGTCPQWHSGAGKKAWLFVDEIIVE
jgi:beta-galactosidase